LTNPGHDRLLVACATPHALGPKEDPMPPHPRHVWLFAMILLLLATPTPWAAEPRPDCQICGMWIDQYRHTRHVFIAKDTTQIMFCNLPCAVRYLKTHSAEMQELQVADYLSAELTDSALAFYLVESDAPPVMSNTSIIAFASREQAEKFQQSHGGRILNFRQVLSLE
jgi:nitrous oxide reductase accessory protein NosL